MKIPIPYGKDGSIEVEVSDSRVAGVVRAKEFSGGGDEEAVFEEIYAHPVGMAPLHEWLETRREKTGKTDLVVVVNDATRPTPTARTLDFLEDKIPGWVDVRYIVACGSHRQPTEEEYRRLFGGERYERARDRVFYHDAKDQENLVEVGETPSGEKVVINRLVAEASSVLVISSVEPHYFAGFTGGRKSFLPGVAAYDVIERNHSMAIRPEARSLLLKGNPVHEGMDEFARVAAGDRTYAFLTVVEPSGRAVGGACGDIFLSLEKCVPLAEEIYSVPVEKKADVVVAVANHPLDINLYQSQKAIENGKLVLRKGGVLILVAECPDGVGPDTFYRLLSSAPSPEEALAEIERGYRLGYHKAAKLAEILTWAEVWVYTDLDAEALEKVHMRKVTDLQGAIDEAIEKTGGDVLFLVDGSMVVPRTAGG